MTIDDTKRVLRREAPHYRWTRRLWAGAAAGAVSAGLIAMLAVVNAAAQDHSGFELITLVTSTFLGSAYSAAHPGLAAAAGIGIHFVFGGALGVLFAFAVRRVRTLGGLLGSGLLYGAVVFVAMAYVVLPVLNMKLAELLDSWWFAFYHLAFGLGLTLMLYAPKWFGTLRKAERRAVRS